MAKPPSDANVVKLMKVKKKMNTAVVVQVVLVIVVMVLVTVKIDHGGGRDSQGRSAE